VFLSVLFLEGAARYLFMGMAMAVGFSVMASYFLSRTVIPTLVMYLLKDEAHADGKDRLSGAEHGRRGFFRRFHLAFERRFEAFREAYVRGLDWALHHNKVVFGVFGASLLLAGLLVPHVGQDFFPQVDAGQIRMHVTAPAGTRIEETEKHFTAVAQAVRELIPEHDRGTITDVIGVPDGINLAVTDSNILSSADGEMLIGLHRAPHPRPRRTTWRCCAANCRSASRSSPSTFEPADIVSQILNFGVPRADRRAGQRLCSPTPPTPPRRRSPRGCGRCPAPPTCGSTRSPTPRACTWKVDQARVGGAGLDAARRRQRRAGRHRQQLRGDAQLLDRPQERLKYAVSVQTPKHLIGDVQDLQNINLLAPDGRQALLGDAATVTRKDHPGRRQPQQHPADLNVRADVQGTDLGSVGRALRKIVDEEAAKLPPGAGVTVQGQVQSMTDAFRNLGLGIVFAAALVYLLMVVNFQSWTDPFIILTALGGAAVGIVLALFATGTTFSVPSMMGAIMAVGVATANSILMVTFANDRRHENGDTAVEAALAAGRTRLRPVLMTALAMIVGMLPMSLGLSEGGEQNAPLGRAVIGGLVVATFATLFFVPVVYTVLRRRLPRPKEDPELHDIPDYHGHHSSRGRVSRPP
jgi:multidrug efflux pump subunit AcrB